MIPFLEKIAERLLRKFPEKMDNIAVVLPSKRSVVFLKHYLAKRIDKPIFLPQFFSIEGFVEELSDLKVMDNISLQFHLYQSYLARPPKVTDSFDEFLNWSQMLLHDFNEVDRNLVDPKSIFSNLKQVKELEGWDVENWSISEKNLSEAQNNFVNFYEHIYNWYLHFNQSLIEQKNAYQGMTYRKAAKEIEKIVIAWDKVWFVGLNALTKSEEKIINHLKEKDIARVFWDTDEFYFNNPNHEAGNFLREQRAKWHEIDFKGVGNYFSKPKTTFDVVGCPKNIAQAKATALVLSQLSDEDLDNSNTAIILADEGLLFPVLNQLPEKVKALNVTMGSPLKNTPLFALVDALIYMQIQAYDYKKSRFYYKDVIKLLEHPFFAKICCKENLSEIKNSMHKENFVFISPSWLQNQLADKTPQNLFVLWQEPKDAIKSLHLLLNLLRKPLVGKKGTIESEILLVFSECLNILERLINDLKQDFQLKTLQKVLNQLVAKEVIPFKGEPLKGVQLMGILESRTLDFKNVIMLSVNEGVLPKGKSLNSFIPYDLKKYFQLPTFSETDAVFSYHFYRILQRAENITLLYNTENDHFGSGEKSRFITQLLAEYTSSPIKSSVYKGEQLQLITDTKIQIENKGLTDSITKWATQGVSPSALNKYNSCSLAFYYHYLANIRKDDEVDEFADASHLGTAVHNTLDNCYKEGLLNEQLIKKWKPAILKRLIIEFELLLKKSSLKEGKNYLTIEIAKQLLLNFLDLEQKGILTAKQDGKEINIKGLEDRLSGRITVNNTSFKLKGRVDRVDEVGDLLRIIDYKTGKVERGEVTFLNWNELSENNKKEKAFQLLMYAYLYLNKNPQYLDKKVVAGNFSFKNLKEGLICVSRNKKNKEGKKSNQKEILQINKNVLQEFEKQLKNILVKIQTEDFKQTDDLKVCEWCDYKLICKR
ncbi:MAG: PD-(D/E)XK nuclease family protein [Bacteroidota bacterium]|nr:PD-(D/E)XK nuclease family protein [Bacteroidota bacterium]